MANIPHGDIHIAKSETDAFAVATLITGDTPPIVTTSEVAAVALPQWCVVGRDSSGKLVKAVYATDNTAIAPIGITVNAVDPAVGTLDTVAVYRAGCFNPDVLTWDESFDTDAKKKAAIEGAGLQIFLVAPKF